MRQRNCAGKSVESKNVKADRETDCGTWRLAVDVGEVDSREQHSASAAGGIGAIGGRNQHGVNAQAVESPEEKLLDEAEQG